MLLMDLDFLGHCPSNNNPRVSRPQIQEVNYRSDSRHCRKQEQRYTGFQGGSMISMSSSALDSFIPSPTLSSSNRRHAMLPDHGRRADRWSVQSAPAVTDRTTPRDQNDISPLEALTPSLTPPRRSHSSAERRQVVLRDHWEAQLFAQAVAGLDCLGCSSSRPLHLQRTVRRSMHWQAERSEDQPPNYHESQRTALMQQRREISSQGQAMQRPWRSDVIRTPDWGWYSSCAQ